MTVEDKIRQAQSKILSDLMMCELRIASLYDVYSAALPSMADFWSKLAGEERDHAELLNDLHLCLDRGYLFRDIGRFTGESLDSLMEKLNAASERAKEGRVLAHEAVSAAAQIETSLLESKFYQTVATDAPEFISVIDRLVQDTEAHLHRIQEALVDYVKPARPRD